MNIVSNVLRATLDIEPQDIGWAMRNSILADISGRFVTGHEASAGKSWKRQLKFHEAIALLYAVHAMKAVLDETGQGELVADMYVLQMDIDQAIKASYPMIKGSL